MKKTVRLWQWVALVALTGIVPLVGISSLLIYNSINKNIDFGQQEIRGNAFQRPLEQLLDLLPRYESAARQALGGDASAKQSMTDVQGRVDAAFELLAANYNGDLGQALKFTDAELAARKRENARLSVVLADWTSLKNSPLAGAAADDLNSKLVNAIRAMISHSGDLSNLILDTDLDSYYLVDVTLSTLPQTQQRLSDMTLQVSAWLRNGQALSNKTQIAIIAAMLQQDDQDRITGDAQTSLNEDKNFYGISETLQKNLPPAIEQYTSADQAVIGLLNRIVAGETVPAADFERACWNARAESLRLWEIGANELDHLLAVRIASFRRQQLASLATIGAVLCLVAAVVWVIVRKLNATLFGLSRNLDGVSHQVADAAAQLSSSSQTLSEGASEQAASLEETSSSLEEMASMVARNAETAQKVSDLAKEAHAAADGGAADMQTLNAAMAAIKISSDDIAKIIKTIDEIALQTNLLALNAAVESARAGEAGMGFAVVADEVRNLAQRSAQAAKETASKIEGAIANTGQGVRISSQVAQTLDGIIAKVRQVNELAAHVAQGSHEETQGITQINIAVSQMDKVTQSNAASAEESSAAAEVLNSHARTMKESVMDVLHLVGASVEALGISEPARVLANSQGMLDLQ